MARNAKLAITFDGEVLFDEPLLATRLCIAHLTPEARIARRLGLPVDQLPVDRGRRVQARQTFHRGRRHEPDLNWPLSRQPPFVRLDPGQMIIGNTPVPVGQTLGDLAPPAQHFQPVADMGFGEGLADIRIVPQMSVVRIDAGICSRYPIDLADRDAGRRDADDAAPRYRLDRIAATNRNMMMRG